MKAPDGRLSLRSKSRPVNPEFIAALRHDVYDLGTGLDGDDCMRLFDAIDEARERAAWLEYLLNHAAHRNHPHSPGCSPCCDIAAVLNAKHERER